MGATSAGIRQSHKLADPYAAVRSIRAVMLWDDGAVPLATRAPGACARTRVVEMLEGSGTRDVEVTWTVWGALWVDKMVVMYGKWSVLDGKIFDCPMQPVSARGRDLMVA